MPTRSFRAPARVNLIGGQVDYHEGIVVGIAIDRDVVVSCEPRDDARIVATSESFPGVVDVAADGSTDPATVEPAWGRAVAGVARVLAERGRDPVSATLRVTSTIPAGAGLSSSAAFEVAVALALADRAALSLPDHELAVAAQTAEHIALGVPCGIQDQLTSIAGAPGHAVRIDCRTLEIDLVPFPPAIGVVVIHSGVERTL